MGVGSRKRKTPANAEVKNKVILTSQDPAVVKSFWNLCKRSRSLPQTQKGGGMSIDIFTIQYLLHGEPKTFVIRAKGMNTADAWHWASCDVGIAPIPKPGRPPLKKFSKPMAERYGIADVRWRASESVDWSDTATS